MAFSIGDRIKNIKTRECGVIYYISQTENFPDIFVRYDNGGDGHSGGNHPASDYYKLIGSTSCKKEMNLLQKLSQSLMAEPEKSFRKLDITNGDNMLTCEGKDVFINWLFQKNKAAFNTEVVVDMIAELEKEKNK